MQIPSPNRALQIAMPQAQPAAAPQAPTQQEMGTQVDDFQRQTVRDMVGVYSQQGPEAVMQRFEALTPQLQQRGADEEFIGGIRQALQRDPEGTLRHLATNIGEPMAEAQPQATPVQGQPQSQFAGTRQGDVESPGLSPREESSLLEMREEAEKASQSQALIDEFMMLNAETSTGGIGGLPGVSDLRALYNPKLRRMKQIQDRLTPAMRQGLPGAASDRDVAMFRSATVGTGKQEEANRATAEAFQASAQRINDQAEFMEEYALANGTMFGAQALWREYKEANPLFYEDESGMVRAADQQGWREYMNWGEGNQKPDFSSQLDGPGTYTWSPEGGFKKD